MSFVSFSLAVIFIIRLFSTSAFRVPNFALAMKNRVCPEIFDCLEYTFTFRSFAQFALALKNRVCRENFHWFEYIFFLSFRIFE